MKKRQQGLTTVEAAIGAALMLIVLFGTIEMARVIFVWNFLDEATRRGARVAAVCPFNDLAVRRVAIFAPPSGPNNSPHVKALTTSDVNVEYLDAAGGYVDSTFPTEEFEKTKFVRVFIDSFNLPLLFYGDFTVSTPQFRTILPSESLGYNPDVGECRCFDMPVTSGDGCDFKTF